MRSYPRKTAPKVRGGKVQKKNRTELSRHYRQHAQDRVFVDRIRPGEGYRHLLLKRDVERFLEMLPGWERLSEGLNAVILAEGEEDCLGWHTPGLVAVCAWERALSGDWGNGFVEEHRPLLDRLDVELVPMSDEETTILWTEDAVKAFQLLHVLTHELGHHHDRMTTRSQGRAARGEDYAESFAWRLGEELWDRFFREFRW